MNADRIIALVQLGACCASHENLGPSVGGPNWQLCRLEPGHEGRHRIGVMWWFDSDEGSIPSPWTAVDVEALRSSVAAFPDDKLERVAALRAVPEADR